MISVIQSNEFYNIVKFKIYSSACRDMRSIIMVHDESNAPPQFSDHHTRESTMIVCDVVCVPPVLLFDDDAVCEITDDGVSSLGVAKEGKPCSLALQDVWSSVIR